MARLMSPHPLLMRAPPIMLLIGAIAAGCTAEPLEPASGSIETVPLHILARNIASYRGQTVRTCGREIEPARYSNGEIIYWRLSVIDPTSPYRFPARVIIPSCNGERPRLRGGCISGRVAREDGSLDPPESVVIGSHEIMSHEWWLHPQCPIRRRP